MAKAAAGGVALVAFGLLAVGGTLTGAGWLLAVVLKSRSEIQSVALPAEARALAMLSLPRRIEQQNAMMASLSRPETAPSSRVRLANPVGRLALVMAEAETTASIGAAGIKVAALGGISKDPSRHSHPADDISPVPLPRIRPKLASLGPAGGAGITLDELRPPRTAIYDITGQMVYMPNGERLEAHSGLGELMDDPNHVDKKNRGATPPNTYNLKLRESLFHGVQAIRMTPVNEKDMFNRDGILAHSYMLGPSGQSNGCISFKDYDRFLQAFLRDEVDRVVVVARLTNSPTFAKLPTFAKSRTFVAQSIQNAENLH